MEATIVLVLVFTLLLGGMTLALVMGYRSVEESRERAGDMRAAAPRPVQHVVVPGFFSQVSPAKPAPPTSVIDEALLDRLAQYVRDEHAVVAQFVHLPSVDSLYRQSGSSLHVH